LKRLKKVVRRNIKKAEDEYAKKFVINLSRNWLSFLRCASR